MSTSVGSTAMGSPFFHEFKKQASFFLKEKLRTARLALTDVTPAELLTEEATNGNPWPPDSLTMGRISRAAFEIDDYWRIVEVLHKRFEKFHIKHWRETYNALIVLDHLLTHGPQSIAEEFQSDEGIILELGKLEYVDEKGFNWGMTVKNKCERVLKLLEKGPVLKEERNRARKVSRGIQGFGTFSLNLSSTDESEETSHTYGRSKSLYEDYHRRDEAISDIEKENLNSDDGVDEQMKNSSDTERRLLEEKSISKSSAMEEVASMVALKSRPVEESKPLLAR